MHDLSFCLSMSVYADILPKIGGRHPAYQNFDPHNVTNMICISSGYLPIVALPKNINHNANTTVDNIYGNCKLHCVSRMTLPRPPPRPPPAV